MSGFYELPQIRQVISYVIVPLLAVAFLALPSNTVSAQTATPIPPTATPTPLPQSMSITPTLGSPGITTVTVTGENFPSGSYSITYANTSVGTVSSTGASWTFSFLVPASALGSHTITAGTSSATFTVNPSITLTPAGGAVGTRVTVKGVGLVAGRGGLPIMFGSEEVGTAATDGNGGFTTSFIVPPRAALTYFVSVEGAVPKSFKVNSSLSLSTSSGPPGTSVNLTGSGFGANASVSITFDGATIRSVSVDNNGAVTTSFQVPAAPGGPRSVGITEPSRGSAQRTFTVTPLISLDRSNTSPGASVNASGVGFAANETSITVTLDQTPVATGISADSKGSWTGSLLIPSLPAGSHTIRASGSLTSSGTVPNLTMTLGSALTLERSSGSPGSILKVSGSGFAPRENITITVGDGLSETTASSDSQGAWVTSLTLPPAPGGRLNIRAAGATGQPKETGFTVTPTVSLSQATGAPDSLVTVEGQGFTANQTGIPIKFGATVVASPSADSQGSWTSTLTVPPSPSGPHFIEVSASPPLKVPFTVSPTINVGGNLGEPGSPVTVTGSGFAANEKGITVTLDQTPVAAGVAANAEGSWSVSFPLPSLPTGTYSILSSGSRTSAGSVPGVTMSVGADLSVERSSGPPGTTLTVNGAGFKSRENITVIVGQGLTETNVAADSEGAWSTKINIPPAPGGPLVIRATGTSGQQIEADFTVTPTVALSQPIGTPGSLLTIEGDGFAAEQGISIGFGSGTVASPSADANGSWTSSFTLPATPAGTYTIVLTGSSGELKVPFLLTPDLVLDVTRGEPGAVVNVSGTGFASNENGISVILDRTPVASGISADNGGSWTASFLVPASPAASYPVRASGPLTSSSDVRDGVLSVIPGLDVNFASGEPGSAVTVAGHGFSAKQRDIVISFDGATVAIVLISDASGSFTTSFVVPPSASGLHFIGHSGAVGDASGGSDISFQVTPGISLEQSEGPPGTAINVIGSGFAANDKTITIAYDSKVILSEVPTDALGSFTASLLVPPSPAGLHEIEASTPALASLAKPQRQFNVTQNLSLNSSSGNVGENVVVEGRGFAPSAPVTLVYGEGLVKSKVESDATGSFRTELLIPASIHGDHVIRVANGEGYDAKATFSLESTPPTAPGLLAPKDGARGGLFGGFRPASRWAAVDDPSGVTYELQLDTDPDFPDPILEKRGLERPSYALADQEALPRGKYYWRVRAVDRAANESPWSSSFVVRSGILPTWVVPALAFLALILAGGGGYAVVGNRRLRSRRSVAIPDLISEVGVLPALPAPQPGTEPAPRPTPRIALPAPSRRRRTRSPEDQARLHLVVDFMRSLPLIHVASDLSWLDELLEASGSPTPEIYEQVLEGQIEPTYQPAWLRHPTYEDVKRILEGHTFLQGLDDYIEAVNGIAGDLFSLLRQVYQDTAVALPQGAPTVYQWRFDLAVVQHALAWFRGTYLREPSARDYIIMEVSGEDSLMSLHGEESTPFSGPLIEGLSETDAGVYRDIHMQLRTSYADSEDARLLASRMATLEILRQQLTANLAELDQSQ